MCHEVQDSKTSDVERERKSAKSEKIFSGDREEVRPRGDFQATKEIQRDQNAEPRRHLDLFVFLCFFALIA